MIVEDPKVQSYLIEIIEDEPEDVEKQSFSTLTSFQDVDSFFFF
jgi:hypothetical protein